jgi:iron complex transport system ATP-binding protein
VDFEESQEGGILVIDPKKETILIIKSLSAAYGEIQALKEITLSLSKGEILGLIGPNGAGKSTLIRVLSGILRPSAGNVLLDDRDISTLTPNQRAHLLAVVPQARQFGGAFTVFQTVLLGRTAYMSFLGRPSEIDLEKTWWAMEESAVDHLAERKLAEISGGEQQRVLLARALAQETPVLLLDEPTNHLDLRYQVSLLNLIKSLAREQDLSVVMAMHDLNQVSGVADRVALLVDGKLAALGLPEEVLTPDHVQRAYQTSVEVYKHPDSGIRHIIPNR